MNENDYPSIICKYCSCTNYGDSPCSMATPSGYASCEGRECDTAYEIESKKIKAVKILGGWRISKAELEKLKKGE